MGTVEVAGFGKWRGVADAWRCKGGQSPYGVSSLGGGDSPPGVGEFLWRFFEFKLASRNLENFVREYCGSRRGKGARQSPQK